MIIKKLIFAPFFVISLFILIYDLKPFLGNYDIIFSLSSQTLVQILELSVLISLTSLFLTLFICFATGWKLASFANFNPISQFSPTIKNLSTLITIMICLIYFLSIKEIIQQNGFQIPDSLIETTLKFSPQPEQPANQEVSLPQISQTLIKETIKSQLATIIKPYLSFIPTILAVFLFFTLQFTGSIINLFISPLLMLIFYILEKSGFVKFVEEMRPVKKLVI